MKKPTTKTKRTKSSQILRMKAVADSDMSLLAATPAFLLATNIAMPAGHGYPKGNISFQFRGLSCKGWERASLKDKFDENVNETTIRFRQLSIDGDYAVMTKYAPNIDIDTAGNLMPLDNPVLRPIAAGADEGGTFDPEQKTDMLNNARLQRDKLSAPDNPNGQKLMRTYNDHNEVYNELFQSNASLLASWKQGDAVAEMAKHTHEATNDGADEVVNDPSTLYGDSSNQRTYNGHAFTQQNAVIAACIAESGYNPWGGGDLPDNKFTQAGLATLNFKKAVGTSGNSSASTTPMTSDEVHGSVKEYEGPAPASTLDELQNQADQSNGSAGADEDAIANGWAILTEEERTQMRYLLTASWEEKQWKKNEKALDLFIGKCMARLSNVQVRLKRLSAADKWMATEVLLPAYELNIEDKHWLGELGETVRERLCQIYFVRSLITEKIKSFAGAKAELMLNVSHA
jgi:hypothetical protein